MFLPGTATQHKIGFTQSNTNESSSVQAEEEAGLREETKHVKMLVKLKGAGTLGKSGVSPESSGSVSLGRGAGGREVGLGGKQPLLASQHRTKEGIGRVWCFCSHMLG
jgi:hypothetical protein